MDFDVTSPFAVIADIHGNADALNAGLSEIDAHGISTILNLGDRLFERGHVHLQSFRYVRR